MIARRSLLIIISSLLTSVLSFIGLLMMTHYLGKDVYGNIAWVMATLQTLNVVSDLGFGSAHIKRLSEGQDERDCISTYFVIKVTLIAVMVGFVVMTMFVWNDISGVNMSSETWNLVILFLMYYVMYGISSIVIDTFTAKMETTKAQLIPMIDPFIRVPLIIFISLNHLPNDLAYAYVFAAVGVLLVAALFLKRSDFRWKKPTLFRSYLKFALPLTIFAIAGAITYNLDKILIGYFDMPGNVAYYSSAQTLLGVLALIGTALGMLAFPSFSKLHSEGDMESIRSVAKAAERYMSMIAIPVLTLIILFPTEVSVTIFGAQFAPGGDVMRFLAIGVGLTLLNQIYTSLILGVDRPDIIAKLTLGTFVLNVTLLLLFIPNDLFGVKMLGMAYVGAAIATALTALAVFLANRFIVKALTGTRGNPRLLRHILAGIIAGAVITLLGMVYPLSGLIALVIFGVVTLAAFYGSLVLLKEFTRADFDYFLDLANPKKMLSYMGGEIQSKK
jgi:O-antigen/teichoic acid export membrane protein